MAKKNQIEKPSLVREHRGRGNGLTLPEKEAIYQAYLALGSKSAAARSLGVSKNTVTKICAEIERSLPPEKIKEARERMSVNLTGRYHETTLQILDSIKPEDMESGRIPEFNSKGEIVGYRYFGPTLVAKATVAGIFTDKIRVLADYEKAIGKDQQSGQLMVPETIDQLIEGIKRGVESIQVLNVNFRKDEPELASKLATAIPVEAEVTDGVPGELDFDNPS